MPGLSCKKRRASKCDVNVLNLNIFLSIFANSRIVASKLSFITVFENREVNLTLISENL